MDCRDMSTLMNARKQPLGPLCDILLAAYAADVEALRCEKVLFIKQKRCPTAAEYATRGWEYGENFAVRWEEMWQLIVLMWSPKRGGVCMCDWAEGCDRQVHRFALKAYCPYHHGNRYHSDEISRPRWGTVERQALL